MHLAQPSVACRMVKSYKTILPHTALLTKEALDGIQLQNIKQLYIGSISLFKRSNNHVSHIF